MRNNDSRAAVRLELTDPLLKDVEEWRRSQAKIPSRTEAIRRLTKQAQSWWAILSVKDRAVR